MVRRGPALAYPRLDGHALARAERETKIRARHLMALESGDVADLPAQVYAKGFLRNYSTYLGLDADEVLARWRKEIEADDAKFLDLVRQENLRLACDALQLFARWSPPAAAKHRRYDTWFFAAEAPPGQQAREDGDEATEALWIAPDAALKARDANERKMIFPTVRNVELLNVSQTAEEVFAFARERRIEVMQPVVIERDGQHFVTIPEGFGYPVTEESLETAFRT